MNSEKKPIHRVTPMSRRAMLRGCANGFGAVALSALAHEWGHAAPTNPMAPKESHYPGKAKSVIFLYMDGGPSQIDTFDPKPRLEKEAGEPIKMDIPKTQFQNVGNVMPCPWSWKQCGESGAPVSDLFPHLREFVDDMAILRSMTSESSEHTSANYFLHTGYTRQGRPGMGSWVTYGLGSESENLPGFVVLDGGLIPPGGMGIFNSGFLPASYQATLFRSGEQAMADLERQEPTEGIQREKMDLIRKLNGASLEQFGEDAQIEAAIANYELAFKMQSAVPDLTDLSGETKATQELYGLDEDITSTFGRQCLLARKLVEKGVRFVECLAPKVEGVNDRWDQHNNLEKEHALNAKATDKPIAGLLTDLKGRGLLDETLVIWGGEFGRTPMAQGSNGRDHNPFGFTMWMAGGGIQGGTVYGATDDYGYFVVDKKLEIYDLHATMLHLLGMDHERLTYLFSGRNMRLTDVHGRIIEDIVA